MKYLLCTLGGLLVGGAAGYFITKRFYEKFSEGEIQEAIDHYESELAKIKKEEPVDIPEEKSEPSEDASELIKMTAQYVNYNDISKPIKTVESRSTKPYAINADQFVNTEPYFDKVTYTYYSEDARLVDPDGDEVDVDMSIGSMAIDIIDGELNEDTFYFRNEMTNIDYEIIVERG